MNRIFFTESARSSFATGLELLNLKKGEKILLPAYIGVNDREGSGVFDPIKEANVNYDFYKINKDLSADLEDIKSKINQGTKAILVIHYFGFMQKSFIDIIDLCNRNSIWLIEDCAHALMSRPNNQLLGTFGDISFFSLHKSLPVKEGGFLLINNKEIQSPNKINKPLSHDIQNSLFYFNYDSIARTKVNNYNYLLSKIESLKNIEVIYNPLPEGVVPLNFPILIKKWDKNKVYSQLKENGVETVSLYYRIIDQISEDKYPMSHELSNTILNLPIHQDITNNDIDIMVEKLKGVIK